MCQPSQQLVHALSDMPVLLDDANKNEHTFALGMSFVVQPLNWERIWRRLADKEYHTFIWLTYTLLSVWFMINTSTYFGKKFHQLLALTGNMKVVGSTTSEDGLHDMTVRTTRRLKTGYLIVFKIIVTQHVHLLTMTDYPHSTCGLTHIANSQPLKRY